MIRAEYNFPKRRLRVSDTTLPTKSSKVPDRKIREIPMKKVSRVIDVPKNNHSKNNLGLVNSSSLP